MEAWIIYVVSFGMLYIMCNIIFCMVFWKPIREQFRQWMYIGRGYCYVRINDLTHHLQEHFMKPKHDTFTIKGKRYLIDPKKVRYKGKAAVYEYREDIAEPIDPYIEGFVGTDAEYLDGFLMKMKALARLMAVKELQVILILVVIAMVSALVAAGIAGYNYTLIDKLVKALIV